MKAIRGLKISALICCMLFPAQITASSIRNNTNENDISKTPISEYETYVVYADMKDESEVKKKAQAIFDLYGSSIIVEVRDYNELNKHLDISEYSLLGTGRWVSNSRTYFIGHITYATEGTIKCFVVEEMPPLVSGCSGKVTIAGNGVTFVSKSLYNTNKTSAYMRWSVKVSDPYAGTTTLSYTVPLYE